MVAYLLPIMCVPAMATCTPAPAPVPTALLDTAAHHARRDAYEYGGAIYRAAPAVASVAELIAPTVHNFHLVPFSGLIWFVTLQSLASGSHSALPRFVRFNIQQALFIDLVLLLPFLFPEMQHWMLQCLGPGGVIHFRTLMFTSCAAAVSYATYRNMQGRLPNEIPLLSDAAGRLVD